MFPKAPANISETATINVLEAFLLTTETSQKPIPMTAKILKRLKLNFTAYSVIKEIKSLIFVHKDMPSFSTKAI